MVKAAEEKDAAQREARQERDVAQRDVGRQEPASVPNAGGCRQGSTPRCRKFESEASTRPPTEQSWQSSLREAAAQQGAPEEEPNTESLVSSVDGDLSRAALECEPIVERGAATPLRTKAAGSAVASPTGGFSPGVMSDTYSV